MLWKPISKLMRRVQRERSGSESNYQPAPACLPSAPFDHGFGLCNTQTDSCLTAGTLPPRKVFPDTTSQIYLAASATGWTPMGPPAIFSDTGDLFSDESWTRWDHFLDEMDESMEYSGANLWPT